jgi:hypothetical protein
VVRLLVRVAALSSAARWIHAQQNAPTFDHPRKLWRHVIDTEGLDGPVDLLEFGVARGWSMGYWLETILHPEARFVGFDTFRGLPEAWAGHAAGSFSNDGVPPHFGDPRCRFVVGSFQETLGGFLAEAAPRRRLVLHLDADLYSSTLFVLATIAPRLESGDILIFDELVGVRTAHHEYRALEDFLQAFPVRLHCLAAACDWAQVALKVV